MSQMHVNPIQIDTASRFMAKGTLDTGLYVLLSIEVNKKNLWIGSCKI